MGFFKKKNNIDSYFEISELNEREDLPKESWKVRPCEWYLDEFKDCKSLKARFQQHFVYGESSDCSQWNTDYRNCMQFRKKKDLKCLGDVVESENRRKRVRQSSMEGNDIWTYRSQPPDNWNARMPEWMVESKKNSVLQKTQQTLDEGLVPEPIFTGFRCSIM